MSSAMTLCQSPPPSLLPGSVSSPWPFWAGESSFSALQLPEPLHPPLGCESSSIERSILTMPPYPDRRDHRLDADSAKRLGSSGC
jgi:hypothetical protein